MRVLWELGTQKQARGEAIRGEWAVEGPLLHVTEMLAEQTSTAIKGLLRWHGQEFKQVPSLWRNTKTGSDAGLSRASRDHSNNSRTTICNVVLDEGEATCSFFSLLLWYNALTKKQQKEERAHSNSQLQVTAHYWRGVRVGTQAVSHIISTAESREKWVPPCCLLATAGYAWLAFPTLTQFGVQPWNSNANCGLIQLKIRRITNRYVHGPTSSRQLPRWSSSLRRL